jgi:hypothetical protein
MLFSTYFGLYSVILRQIISTQRGGFLLDLRLDHICVTNMIADKFLLLRFNSYLSIRGKKNLVSLCDHPVIFVEFKIFLFYMVVKISWAFKYKLYLHFVRLY